MCADQSHNQEPVFDRRLLLGGAKRDAVLDLWEIERYGFDSYGEPDYVSIYGMPPSEWYGRGIRLLGRTAVECTRDRLAAAISEDVASVAGTAPGRAGTYVLDPFVGSGNTLYWLLRRLAGSRGMGFELDPVISQVTRRNLAILGLPITVVNQDYRTGLADLPIATSELLVAFIAPPWGDALTPGSGLDLRRTSPPVADVVDKLVQQFPKHQLLCAIQTYATVNASSLTELASRFDWSARKTYNLNEAGENHGVLLGARGWILPNPSASGLTP